MLYTGLELYLAILGGSMTAFVVGWGFGRDGFMANTLWTRCVFVGTPPDHYDDWNQFMRSTFKDGVTIRKSVDSDWLPQSAKEIHRD